MDKLFVCSLERLHGEAARLQPEQIISMLDPGTPLTTPDSVDADRHHRFFFHDISDLVEDQIAPSHEHIERVLEIGTNWAADEPLLIHCYAGVSRSTAAALILLCQRNPGREKEAARLVRQRGAHAWPNRLMIQIADDLLQREGRMIDALHRMPLPEFVSPEPLMALPVEL
jgi:predicted protein tyrosine phosphatase